MQMTLKHFSDCLFYFCSTCADCLNMKVCVTYLKPKTIGRATKVKIFNSNVKAVLLYASES